MRLLNILVSVCLLFGVVACSGDDDEEIQTRCGAVFRGELLNPIRTDNLIDVVIVGALNGNLVSVSESDGTSYLVILQGLRSARNSAEETAANNFIRSFGPNLQLAIADEDCTDNVQGFDELLPGQIFADGRYSLSEELLLRGLASVDTTSPACDGDLIVNCLAAVEVAG